MCRYKDVSRALEAQAIEKFVLRFPQSPVHLQKVCVKAAWKLPLDSSVHVHQDPVYGQSTHLALRACSARAT